MLSEYIKLLRLVIIKKYKIIWLQVMFSNIEEKTIGYSIIQILINGIDMLKTVFTKVFWKHFEITQ